MTDAERTSTQVEEQEEANENEGVLNKIVETTKNLVETVTETAKDVVGTVAEHTPAAVSSVVEKVRGNDTSSEAEASTNAVEDGGTDASEAQPVAVAESVSGDDDSAAPKAETQDSPVAQVAEAVSDVAEAVRRRVSRVYGALTGAKTETEATDAAAAAPEGEGATYQPAAEDGAKAGRPRRFKDVQPGMQLQGKVTSIALYGIFVDVGVGRDGLVHISEMSEKRIDTPTDLVQIGQPVDVWVKSVDPDARRISLTMRDPNRAKPERAERRGPRKREVNRDRLAEMKVGDSIEGTISSLSNFGAFVDIGVGKDGLVHVSELAEGRVERAEDVVKVGETHTFKVLEVDPEGNRISLSLRRAQRQQRMQQLEPGTVMEGTISGIAPFGAFVDVGVGRDGLIHISELSGERVNSVEEAVKVGDKVSVRVIEVDPNSKRISLTMRVDEPLPKERERPAPRTPGFGGERTFTPSASGGPAAPSYSPPSNFGSAGLPPMEDNSARGGSRRGGRDSGRGEGGRDFGGRGGEGRAAGGGGRRDRNDRVGGGAGRSGGGRGRGGEGRNERFGEGYEAAEEVYTVEDPEEEAFSGDATLQDLLSKFNSGKGRDRRSSREEDEEREGDRRADAIRRTLALRDEE